MSSDRRRVVVTGIGAVTPLGNDAPTTWQRMLAGVSGAGPITRFDASEHAVRIAAELKGFDPGAHFERRELRRLDPFSQYFLVAAREAMADAGLVFEEESEEAFRAGVVTGVGFGGMESFIGEIDVLRSRGPDRVSPVGVPKIIPNIAAGLASMEHHLMGPVTCVVTACAASANAIGDAAEFIRRGAADVMLAGGSEAGITDYAVAAFAKARALSTRNDEPERASRPFDADRDGFLMGEGAGALVLEERERALARGADVYGEVLGYGSSADAYHITLPRPGGSGPARAMRAALVDAGLDAEEIDYVNAHGTSTPANDVTETAALKLALGEDVARRVPISSTKSMTGHMLGAAGAVEAIACLMAIRFGVVPPTINYETPDPECDLDYVPNEAREVDVRYAMSNNLGFGGHNAVLVLGRA